MKLYPSTHHTHTHTQDQYKCTQSTRNRRRNKDLSTSSLLLPPLPSSSRGSRPFVLGHLSRYDREWISFSSCDGRDAYFCASLFFFLRARASPPPVESLNRIERCMTGGFGWPDITRFIPRVLRLAAAINLFLASTFDDPLSLIASHQNRQEDVIYNPFLFPASLFPLHSLFLQ